MCYNGYQQILREYDTHGEAGYDFSCVQRTRG